MVDSVGVVDTATTFVVEVDLPGCGVDQGAMLIVTQDAAMEGELVLIDTGAAPVFGTLAWVREHEKQAERETLRRRAAGGF